MARIYGLTLRVEIRKKDPHEDANRKGPYIGEACIPRAMSTGAGAMRPYKWRPRGQMRCGVGDGRTPRKAFNSALRALARAR